MSKFNALLKGRFKSAKKEKMTWPRWSDYAYVGAIAVAVFIVGFVVWFVVALSVNR